MTSKRLTTLGRGSRWRVGDTEFVSGYGKHSTAERLIIRKPPDLVERYARLAERHKGGNVFELGIAAGGSTALLALLAEPKKLAACDIDAAPVQALTEFLCRHELEGQVRPRYGIDQASRASLEHVYMTEFAGEPLDLVVDDASHEYGPTVASFELLFPRLRHGGAYIIEDWAADFTHARWVVDAAADTTAPDFEAKNRRLVAEIEHQAAGNPHRPLPRVAIELLLAAAMSSDVVSHVSIDKHWLEATRGPADLDPMTFCLKDLFIDYFGWMAPD